MTTSRFKPGESGNKNGRPPGKTAGAKIREAIAENSDLILQAVIEAAVNGDMQACKMLLDRITPPLKAQAMPVTVKSGKTLAAKGDSIIKATMSGTISPDIGAQLITALAAQSKLVELDSLTERVKALEAEPPEKALEDMTKAEIQDELRRRGLPTQIFVSCLKND